MSHASEETVRQRYEEVPYTSFSFPHSCPEHLHAVGRLFGIEAPDPHTARVLEIGCASGMNLLPYAARNPASLCLGIDLSEIQIGQGKAVIAEHKLTNIVLKRMSISDLPRQSKPFDYIICHGVFSWVDKVVQDHILSYGADNLSHNGLFYVSYNTYPGWKNKEIIRDAMRYRGRRQTDALSQLKYGLGMIEFLNHVVFDGSPLSVTLRDNERLISSARPDYLIHEFLEPHNQPVYFSDMVKRAGETGLMYLADAQPASMFASNYGAMVAEPLLQEVQDQLEMEQYLDFVSNRSFRQSIWMRDTQSLKPQYRLSAAVMKGLTIAGSFRRVDGEGDASSSVTFQNETGTRFVVHQKWEAEFLDVLTSCYPGTVSFDSMVDRFREGTTPARDNVHAEVAALFERFLIQGVLRWRATSDAKGNSKSTPWSHNWKDRVWTLCPGCIPADGWITSIWHETVFVHGISQYIVRLLSSPCRGLDIQSSVATSLANGTLKLPIDNGSPSADDKSQDSAHWLEKEVPFAIQRLWRAGIVEPLAEAGQDQQSVVDP